MLEVSSDVEVPSPYSRLVQAEVQIDQTGTQATIAVVHTEQACPLSGLVE